MCNVISDCDNTRAGSDETNKSSPILNEVLSAETTNCNNNKANVLEQPKVFELATSEHNGDQCLTLIPKSTSGTIDLSLPCEYKKESISEAYNYGVSYQSALLQEFKQLAQ